MKVKTHDLTFYAYTINWCIRSMFRVLGIYNFGLGKDFLFKSILGCCEGAAFQYLIFMAWRSCDLNFEMISLLASKCQDFKLRCFQFHFIKRLKNGIYSGILLHKQAIQTKHFDGRCILFWCLGFDLLEKLKINY